MAATPLFTLYMLPGDNPALDDFERLHESLAAAGPLQCVVVQLAHRSQLAVQQPTTPWWGFLFANEWFDPDLAQVLPVFCALTKKDCLTFYKKVVDAHGDDKYELATRMFRTECVRPGIETYKDVMTLTYEICLDGWVREADRL